MSKPEKFERSVGAHQWLEASLDPRYKGPDIDPDRPCFMLASGDDRVLLKAREASAIFEAYCSEEREPPPEPKTGFDNLTLDYVVWAVAQSMPEKIEYVGDTAVHTLDVGEVIGRRVVDGQPFPVSAVTVVFQKNDQGEQIIKSIEPGPRKGNDG